MSTLSPSQMVNVDAKSKNIVQSFNLNKSSKLEAAS